MARIRMICWLIVISLSFGCDNTENPPDGDPDSDSQADGDADSDADGDSDSDSDGDCDGDQCRDTGTDGDIDGDVPMYAELWYSSGDLLVLIQLDTDDGTVTNVVTSSIQGLESGQNCLTMLEDGSLLGARLGRDDDITYFYHIADPPRDGSDAEYDDLGVMPDNIGLEALYTDCEGRIYGMDTGVDDSSSEGNRLLLFTGNILGGDYTFRVVSDLSVADVADIDDMGPGITKEGEISDNPGFAIDTSSIYDFNFETGTGTQVATGGTWGIHALGGELFNDEVPRLYVLSRDAELFEIDPFDYTLSDVLVTGPATGEDNAGWSGLAGPLTDCESGFILY